MDVQGMCRRNARSVWRFLKRNGLGTGWVILFFLLAFESALRDEARVFNYADEAATIIMVAIALVSLATEKRAFSFLPQEKRAALLLVLFVVIGLAGGAISGVQPALVPIAIDLFACIKFFVALMAGVVVFRRGSDDFVHACIVVARVVIVVAAVCAALNLFVDIGMCTVRLRMGMRPFSFVFYHPYAVNVMCVGFMALFATNPKANRVYLVLSCFVMVSTLRAKGVAFVVVAAILLVTVGRGQRLSSRMVAVATIAAVLVVCGQIVSNYANPEEARFRLTIASLEIANTYAPLGAGFATFGSNVTTLPEYYSSLYYDYGLSTVWGLRPTGTQFVSDTFFPIILGQCGWLGLLCYGAFVVEMLQAVRLRTKMSSANPAGALLVAAFLVLSCLSDSAFFGHTAIFLAFSLVLCLSCRVGVASYR